ncbi:hypothetical protein ABFS83_01G044600 [Erythranthe nasuta]
MDSDLNTAATLTKNKVERNSEMGRGKLNCGNLTNIESLPDELVFDILLHLPAEDIYNGPMFVCRKWYDMVRTSGFISAHLQKSTPHLVIHSTNTCRRPYFVEMNRGRIDITRLNCVTKTVVWASCNGLMLESDFSENRGDFYVTNPATNQHFALPRFPCEEGFRCCACMAYAEASKQYKVVIMYCKQFHSSVILKSAILTVGVDKSWRELRIKDTYEPYHTTTTRGFIHWQQNHQIDTHVLSLNVETETFRETPITTDGGRRLEKESDKYYASTGDALTIFVARSEFSWEVMRMESETGELRKVAKIDMEARLSKIEDFLPKPVGYVDRDGPRVGPVGWINYPEVLVLWVYSYGVCMYYNVRTQEISCFRLEYLNRYHRFLFHINSLVWLDGC